MSRGKKGSNTRRKRVRVLSRVTYRNRVASSCPTGWLWLLRDVNGDIKPDSIGVNGGRNDVLKKRASDGSRRLLLSL